ncbi:MAG: immunoglobulin-like domain-containing protein [Lactimicrobium sp.]|jgi:lipoprotein-anchoring transpeptidase ErfK/SrfK|uniref:immunoglobulin-like domain-containing protein n=1 Tax=Lactimicrobium sp. TaxID=2563780 RepID=UPI002F35C911
MAMKKTYRLAMICLFLLMALFILLAGRWTMIKIQHYKAYKQTENSMVLKIGKDKLTIEAGSDVSLYDAIHASGGTLSASGSINTSKPGSYPVVYALRAMDKYGREILKKRSVIFTVEDTTAPVITLKTDQLQIAQGADFDPSGNVSSIMDTVDGSIAKDKWQITSQVNTSQPGSYPVMIEAADTSGNSASASYTVTVVTPAADEHPYLVRVNRAANTVTVYAKDDAGNYSLPYKAFLCSTGPDTPLGSYTTFGQSRWRSLFDNASGQYVTDIVDDILFHSVPYTAESPDTLEYDEYNKLGSEASLGCVRLQAANAKWIYDNCPLGTTVEFYDDADNPGPFGKPDLAKIDTISPNRGWDPTDPDPDNPWNK